MTNENTSFELNVFTAQTGLPSARLDRADGTFLHLHSLVDPQQEANYFASIPVWGERFIFAGGGLGYHLLKLLQCIKPGTPMLLIEYYPELAHHTAIRIAGETGVQPLVISSQTNDRQAIIDAFNSTGGHVQVIRHPASYCAHEQFYRLLLHDAVPKKVIAKQVTSLLFTRGDFFVEQELHDAAVHSGMNCSVLQYKKNDKTLDYEANLQKEIERNTPQCIISVNMLGVDYNGVFSSYTSRYGIPSVHWFVDDPRPILLNRINSITSAMVACTWERRYVPFLESCGFGKVVYLPLAADGTKMPLPTTSSHKREIAFLGSSMGTAFLDSIASKFIWKPHYAQIAQEIGRAMVAGDVDDVDDALKAGIPESGTADISTTTWLRSYILHTASMLKRKQYINALIPFAIELCGDEEGWQDLLGVSIHIRPALDYQSQASSYYHTTAVNINITSSQMPTAVNQRVFDVPYNNGFLLTDYQSDLDELFSHNEYAAYSSVDELVEKTAYYLTHLEAREKITAAAHKRIRLQHTYKHRLAAILNSL